MNPTLAEHIDDLIARHLSDLVALRHDLHAHPQLGYKETYASAMVRRELDAAGVEYEKDIAQTGVVGRLGDGGGAIGLRADMDALPIDEQTMLPYASQHPGCMHACGHDGHTTILIGAARVLSELRDQLPRPVRFVFQPAEEIGAGAKRMIEGGALKDVSTMFGLHGVPMLPVGVMASRSGPLMAAPADFTIEVRGRGGHGAMPHLCHDPIVAAAQIVTALQTIITRDRDPVDPAVISVGSLHAGEAPNVIPDTATIRGTYRFITPATGVLLRSRMNEVAAQIAAAHRCTAHATFDQGYPVLVNDPGVCAYAMSIARRTLGEKAVIDLPVPVMPGEDFAFYGQHVPSFFAFIGVRPHDRQDYPGLHSSQYDFTDAAIPVGIRLMCAWALNGGPSA